MPKIGHDLIQTVMLNACLDVDDVRHVVNFDYPNNSEDYVHRIGRTGRSGRNGTSYTFFTAANAAQARSLVKVLEEANQPVNPDLLEFVDDGRSK